MTSRSAAVISAALFFFLFQAKADELDLSAAETQNQTGEVTVEKTEDYGASYKERRGQHGFLFSILSEKIAPVDYSSTTDTVPVVAAFGDDTVDLIGVELGYKYNFSLGSLGFLFNYATGSGDHQETAESRKLTLTKQGLSVSFALDNILQEPWVVPFVEGGAHQFVVTEEHETVTEILTNDETTGIALNYKLGLSFQLDWIEKLMDKTAQADRLRSSGLENTFIDVYYANYLASSNAMDSEAPDPEAEANLSSAGQIGIGLKLEF